MAAADINVVSLVGRATRDSELRGESVLSVRLAFTSRVKNGDQWDDKSNYADVVIFGNRARGLERYIVKGQRIGVVGRLDWREWTTDNGDRRQALQVIANEVQLLGSAGERSEAIPPTNVVTPERAPLPDDDIPF